MIKEFIDRIAGSSQQNHTLDGKLKSQTVVSTKMMNAIRLWSEMYRNIPPWRGEKGLDTQTQNLPAAISREFARLITQESEISVSGGVRGEYINEQLQRFLRYFSAKVEKYCATGGVAIKPYISGQDIALSLYTADRFYPTAYNTNGDISGAVFVEQMRKGDYVYTRLEWHNMTYNADASQIADETKETSGTDSNKSTGETGNTNLYTVINQAFRSEKLMGYSGDTEYDMLDCRMPLQDEIPLSSIPEWSDIEPKTTIQNLENPLFVYIRVPGANNVDTDSPLGASVYSLAVDVIREADRQYTRCIDEYVLKEAAIHASSDMFKSDKTGKPILPEGKERVYRTLDDEGAEKPTLQDFSPDIRDTSFFNGLEKKKREIEFLCGLAYGTLSEVQETAKTATEIKVSKQRSYTTICNMQKEWTQGFEKLCYAINALADLYELAPESEYELTCTWGDNVMEDTDVEYNRRLQMTMAGMIRQSKFVAWYFGCTEDDAIKEYMPPDYSTYPDTGNNDNPLNDDGGDGDA